MKTTNRQMIRLVKAIFGFMIFAVILLLFFGEIYMPVENPTESGEAIVFDADWKRVYPDGSKESIMLPKPYDAERGEVVRLETTLPQDQCNTWFCMRASQQDMRIFVGDELRKEYTTKGTRLFGENSASAFVFFEISDKDAGKVLAIEVVSNAVYAGLLNEVYTGDKYDIVSAFVRECSAVILVSFCMLILSVITFLAGCVLCFIYKKSVNITYLGLGVLQISLTMITESRIRQFFMPNSSVAAHIGFLLTMLIPYPFIIYVGRVQKGRYQKAYRLLLLCVAVNTIGSVLLQLLGIVDFADSSVISYGLILVMVIVVAVTIILDIRKGKIREYGEVVFGIIAMIPASVWEIYITFVPKTSYYGGVALSFGLILLLFMAGIKTAGDMQESEKEKQMAILAGEAKAQFLTNMSHEIRTPINTIIGMNEMILRENENKEVEEYAKNVQSASGLLLGLVNDILDFSKIDSGKMDIVETEYSLSKMLTDVTKGMQIKADSKNLRLDVVIEESLPSVLKGDEIRIRQILNNLLSNAVKYTNEGKIVLSVKGEHHSKNFILSMSVEDTGIGIKSEDVDKLFESFRRLEEQKNRYIEGTGLGLNITRQLVELMNGSIEVKSEYGRGSCFTVKIPQQIISETAMGTLEEAYRRDVLKKTEIKVRLYAPKAEILVVDDNKMNLSVVKTLLKRTGIRLTFADNGIECLKLCRNQKYDLILMDHMMPDPDGIETLHRLRDDMKSLNSDTDVIVFTANAIVGMPEMYLKEGFIDYLSKPIIADDLENMIYRYLPVDKLETQTEGERQLEKNLEGMDIEVPYLDKKSALKYCADSEAIYKEMLETYCQQGEKYYQELSEYFAVHDWKQYRIIVHALKGTSLMIGASVLSEKAKRLEDAAKICCEEVIFKEHEAFMKEYGAVLKLIAAEKNPTVVSEEVKN